MASSFCCIVTSFELDTQLKKHGVCEFMQDVPICNLVRELAFLIGYEAST